MRQPRYDRGAGTKLGYRARLAMLLLTAIAGSVLGVPPARADWTTGSIAGRVTTRSQTGEIPLEGARVTLRSPVEALQTSTDRHGYFSLVGLAPQTSAMLTVAKEGYETAWADVPICVGATLKLEIPLHSWCSVGCGLPLNVARTYYATIGTQHVIDPGTFMQTTWQGQC